MPSNTDDRSDTMALHLDQKLATCLWFANEAEPAARFYTSIFPRSRIDDVLRWGNVGPGPKGAVLMVTFSLMGEQVLALNGNTQFPPTPAASLSVLCDTQAEIDRYWKALLRGGGKEMMCGWLTDRFGISWQIVPRALPRMIRDKHQAKADRAMAAMMGMVKLDLAALQAAYAGDASRAAKKTRRPAKSARRR